MSHTDPIDAIDRLLQQMEDGQREKVISLARRLKPGLTAEDIRNPHDFPELSDPDWHYEDGQLAAIQAVRFAIHRLTREIRGDVAPSKVSTDGPEEDP